MIFFRFTIKFKSVVWMEAEEIEKDVVEKIVSQFVRMYVCMHVCMYNRL